MEKKSTEDLSKKYNRGFFSKLWRVQSPLVKLILYIYLFKKI